MKINKSISDDLIAVQEDIASHFCNENFPLSGEIYWTLVESIATAKLMEMNPQDSF